MSTPTVIELKNLTKIYPGRHEPAINNLTLEIEKNAFYGLLGPNGAGKTTAISIISSLIEPTKGEVLINGLNLKHSLTQIKRMIGVVSQEIALYDKMTAYENLYYFGILYEINKKELKQKIDQLLDRLGLLKYKNNKIQGFSGGMKRRINLMAGLLHDPDILILDEPVVGVDVHSRNVIREFLKEVNENNTTIIYTSHIMEDAEKLCTNTSILDYGEIVEQGSPAELIAKHKDCDSLESVFLKLTGQNLRD